MHFGRMQLDTQTVLFHFLSSLILNFGFWFSAIITTRAHQLRFQFNSTWITTRMNEKKSFSFVLFSPLPSLLICFTLIFCPQLLISFGLVHSFVCSFWINIYQCFNKDITTSNKRKIITNELSYLLASHSKWSPTMNTHTHIYAYILIIKVIIYYYFHHVILTK